MKPLHLEWFEYEGKLHVSLGEFAGFMKSKTVHIHREDDHDRVKSKVKKANIRTETYIGGIDWI